MPQHQCLWRIDGRNTRLLAIDQAVQDVEDMGFCWGTRLQRQFDRAQYGLLVMVQNEGEDLHHLPITARLFEEMGLQPPERIRQSGKGRPIAPYSVLRARH